MLPIDNENYGILYSFQPNYLAHLIQDDNGNETGIVDVPEQQETKSTWQAFTRHLFAFMKK
jgi:hypothetical protein